MPQAVVPPDCGGITFHEFQKSLKYSLLQRVAGSIAIGTTDGDECGLTGGVERFLSGARAHVKQLCWQVTTTTMRQRPDRRPLDFQLWIEWLADAIKPAASGI